MKKTLVIGASTKPNRYSYKAVSMLRDYGHEVIAIGNKSGSIKDIEILTTKSKIDNLDTISLYLSDKNQVEYYDYILSLKPKRVIMNPGTENPELSEILKDNNIEVVEHCTLVMLDLGSF
jgi:predicted CoA-binding protein